MHLGEDSQFRPERFNVVKSKLDNVGIQFGMFLLYQLPSQDYVELFDYSESDIAARMSWCIPSLVTRDVLRRRKLKSKGS